MARAAASVDISAPLVAVMSVLRDVERYPEFLPEVEAVRVLRREPPELEVCLRLRIIRSFAITLRLLCEEQRLSWSLVEGPFHAVEGAWKLEPLPDGGTRLHWSLEVQPAMTLPGSLVQTLRTRRLPLVLERFRARLEGSAPAGG